MGKSNNSKATKVVDSTATPPADDAVAEAVVAPAEDTKPAKATSGKCYTFVKNFNKKAPFDLGDGEMFSFPVMPFDTTDAKLASKIRAVMKENRIFENTKK